MFRFLGGKLRALAGISKDILSDCPQSERIKFNSIGAALFIPPLVGALTVGYLIYTFCHNPFLAWCISALFWAPLILCIDQALISTFRKPGFDTPRKYLSYVRLFIPRIVIGAIIGAIIAAPAELIVFHGPIQNHIQQKHQRQINNIKEQYNQKNQEISNRIDTLKDQIRKQQNRYYHFSYLASNEIHGNKIKIGEYSTSGIKGKGPQYRNFVDMKQQTKAALESVKNNNLPEIQRLQDQIEDNREMMKKEIDSIKKTQSSSFLYQYLALQDLSKEYPNVKIYKYLIFVLILVLELLPVFIRITTPQGKYDEILNSQEFEEKIDNAAWREALRREYPLRIDKYYKQNVLVQPELERSPLKC